MEVAALLSELEEIGLRADEWELGLSAFVDRGIPVVADFGPAELGGKLVLELSYAMDDGLGLEGYEVWLPRS